MTSSHLNCEEMFQSLLKFLNNIHVSSVAHDCRIVLPLFSYDKRNISVYISPFSQDSVILHDGGKTLSEFWAQGLYWESSQKFRSYLEKMLVQYELLLGEQNLGKDTLFKKVPIDALPLEIWRFGSSLVAISSLLIEHKLKQIFPIKLKIESMVESRLQEFSSQKHWSYKKKFKIKGQTEDHHFDFVLQPQHKEGKILSAIDILTIYPSPLFSARIYRYKIMDLGWTNGNGHPSKVVILPLLEQWSKSERAIKILRMSADKLLYYEPNKNHQFIDSLNKTLSNFHGIIA